MVCSVCGKMTAQTNSAFFVPILGFLGFTGSNYKENYILLRMSSAAEYWGGCILQLGVHATCADQVRLQEAWFWFLFRGEAYRKLSKQALL